MTADEFRTALRVLDEGRAAHNIYEMEDAAAALTPVRRAYGRVFMTVCLAAIVPVSLASVLVHVPFLSPPIALLLPSCLLSLRSFRDRFMPVRGLEYRDIVRAALR